MLNVALGSAADVARRQFWRPLTSVNRTSTVGGQIFGTLASAIGREADKLANSSRRQLVDRSIRYAVSLRPGAAIDHSMLESAKSWVEENRSTPSPHTCPNGEREVPSR